tara:strand:+ start:134 stop:739 length:606 start_codon:yes stop_codon:yes gene_type:complete
MGTFVKSLERLNPETITHAKTLEELIYDLKIEQYRYSHDYIIVGRGKEFLQDTHAAYLILKNSKAHDLDSISLEQLTEFYTNGLQGLIDRAYMTILQVKAHTLLYGEPLSISDLKREHVNDLTNYLYELNRVPTHPNERTVNAEEALEYLAEIKAPSKRELQDKAFLDKEKVRFCCANRLGGCRLCPNNRATLRSAKNSAE